MSESSETLNGLDGQRRAMLATLRAWCQINSGTFNLAGLERMSQALSVAFAPLAGQMMLLEVDPWRDVDERGAPIVRRLGKALLIRQRPEAPRRVLLCGHMDTVYAADHPFQHCAAVDEEHLRGPGVTDMKGGLVVMLHALLAFERSGEAANLGYDVLITPDEEIGSVGSRRLLEEAAKRHQVGLVFEPTASDGSMVDRRKGSGNFALVIRGRAAHAGRTGHRGRSALLAAARFTLELEKLAQQQWVSVNVGRIEGGGPVNIVPDLAVVRFNVRVEHPVEMVQTRLTLEQMVRSINALEGYTAVLHGDFTSPPKPLDRATRQLTALADRCAAAQGLTLAWSSSGGVTDGNKLAAAGLPNLDTLGVQGGEIHSDREFVVVGSLTQRAALAAAILIELARGAGPVGR